MGNIFGFNKEYAEKIKAQCTINEISRQKLVWESIYNQIINRKEEIHNFLKNFDRNTRIIFTGAGSSGFVGDSLAPIIRKELQYKSVDSIHTTDIVASPEQYLIKDVKTLLISFARSGNSPESVAAVEIAEKAVDNIYHLIITCNPKGALANFNNDRTLNLVFSEVEDQGFAMTSSVTGMMLAAYCTLNIDIDLTENVKIISSYAEEIMNNKFQAISEAFEPTVDRLVVLGAGNLYGMAREAALKIVELTAGKIISRYDTPMGFRHGPKSMLTENTVILYFVSNNDYTREYDYDMLQELSNSLKHKLVVVSDKYYAKAEEYGDIYVYNSLDKKLEEAFTSYTAVLTAQLFALFASIKLGCTPDNPFPSGEVNRVVKGVTIHKF